jgi:hypothetical protein
MLAGAGGRRKVQDFTRSPGFITPARSGRSTPLNGAEPMNAAAGPLVVGYLRADTDEGAAPLIKAIVAYARSRMLGKVSLIHRDPATTAEVARPGYFGCLQVCAHAVSTARPVIVVPTPAHLAADTVLCSILLGQALHTGAAVMFIDGRPATSALDGPVADPELAPALAQREG